MSEQTEKWFVATEDAVAASLRQLRMHRVHEQFIAYLCLLFTSAEQDSLEDLTVSFKSWHERFLKPGDGTERQPYFSPFSSHTDAGGRAPGKSRFMTGRNVAGSYGPSSFRPDSPLLTVASYAGENRKVRFSLKNDHAHRALDALLYGNRMSAVALAVILYRDYGFDVGGVEPIVSVFREEFGLSGSTAGDANFATLFDPDPGFLAGVMPLSIEHMSASGVEV